MKRVRCRNFWSGEGECITNVNLSIDSDGLIAGIDKLVSSSSSFSFDFAMPSFVDAHTHYSWMIVKEASFDLSGVFSCDEFLSVIKATVDSHGGEGIVRFESYDESLWDLSELPCLAELDSVTGKTPVFCRRVCGHVALVNSAMLDLIDDSVAGVNRQTGFLTEWPVLNFEKLFPFSEKELLEAVEATNKMIFSKGVTALYTFEPEHLINLINAVPTDLDLSIGTIIFDIDSFINLSNPPELIKIFLDGSIGAGNAAMQYKKDNREPSLHYSDTELHKLLLLCGNRGISVAVHVIGGDALKQLDRISSAVFNELGHGFFIRVEHAEDLLEAWPGSWDKNYHFFSMQPNFVRQWQNVGGMYDKLLSAAHSRKLNPFRVVKEAGFGLGFGSDGMPFDPLFGLYGAINHRNPEFSLSPGDALLAYTIGAASISGFKHLAEPAQIGRVADLVFLSGNPFIDIGSVVVEATMKNGKFVYKRNG